MAQIGDFLPNFGALGGPLGGMFAEGGGAMAGPLAIPFLPKDTGGSLFGGGGGNPLVNPWEPTPAPGTPPSVSAPAQSAAGKATGVGGGKAGGMMGGLGGLMGGGAQQPELKHQPLPQLAPISSSMGGLSLMDLLGITGLAGRR